MCQRGKPRVRSLNKTGQSSNATLLAHRSGITEAMTMIKECHLSSVVCLIAFLLSSAMDQNLVKYKFITVELSHTSSIVLASSTNLVESRS